MLTIHDTSDWPAERILPYGPDITAAMRKLAECFPRDVSVDGLFKEIVTGSRTLWIVLDGDRFVSFAVTQIKDNPQTGNRLVVVTEGAGEQGEASAQMVGAIEEWARSHGAHEVAVVGRPGWGRPLKRQGYTREVVTYRKLLEAA